MTEPRPFEELSPSGLLWLINRTVFHPRGYALTLTLREGKAVGWNLQGDGTEVWRFSGDEDARFEAAEATLAGSGRHGPTCTCPQHDITTLGEKPGSRTAKGYDPDCPVCPNPYAAKES